MNQSALSALYAFAAAATDKDILRPADWTRFRRLVIDAHVERQAVSSLEMSEHLSSLGFPDKQASRLGRFYTRAHIILTAIDSRGCALN